MRIDYPEQDQLPLLRKLWMEAFGDDDSFLNIFYGSVFSPDRCRCVTSDGQVTAALYWLDCRCNGKPIAYLYAIATGKKYRHRGQCRALMDDTHRLLRELGYAGAVLVPGEKALFMMYRALGYETCSQIHQWHCFAAGIGTALREISVEEYGAARRRYLPEGGVIQENENLTFLQSQTRLYAGADFILCAREQRGTLLCPEILGNISAAPRILTALGYSDGHFRSPGTGTDFAMYYPLSDSPAPTYFGLAFD